MERTRISAVFPLALVLALAAGVQAGEVLEQVPRDALGVLVVRNLAEADAKFGNVLGAAGSRLPGPLALLKSIAGLNAGLDQRRDMLVVLLPPQRDSRQFRLAVWLPVRDYDALVRSLDGDPARRVAAITIADEDLLVARHGSWAVVMDIDERDRLELLRDTEPSPPPLVAEWSEWIDTNDAAIVVLPAGRRAAWAWAVEEGLLSSAPVLAPAAQGDDLFGPANRTAPSQGWSAVQQSIRTALATAPELARWAAEAEGVACGLRLDEDGNALAGLRVAVAPEALAAVSADQPSSPSTAAPHLYSGGPFVITGSGRVSPHWIQPLVAPYIRQQTNELMAEYEGRVSPEDLASVCRSAEAAATEVSAFAVLTRPGTGGDGVYTNNFLALRVASSDKFVERAGKLVQEWNTMVGKVDALKLLAFDSRSITVSERHGREYAIDMTAAAGGPPLPEIKATMVKLFGPGGKFRVQVVAIDESNVLLAVAATSQVAELMDAIKVETPEAAESHALQVTTELFAGESAWRLYFSPRGYTDWLRRQFDALLGEAIGAPVVHLYPKSPPIGVAGGVDNRALWTEVAVPIETLRAFARFSRQ